MTATIDTTALVADALPITESQKGLVVIDSRVPAPEIYNQVGQFEVDAAITPERVREALRALVTVQPSLRAVFGRLPDLHARLTPPPTPAELQVECIEVVADEYESALADAVRRVGGPAFDLTEPLLVRFAHVRSVEADRAAIVLCMHHLVGDGFSIAPLVRDLERVLSTEIDPDAVEALRVDRERAYRRELEAQTRVSAQARTLERARAWAERLREVPPLVIYPRPHRPMETSFRGRRITWWMDDVEAAAVNACCRDLSITPFVFFTAVYGAVLARHGGVRTVLIGSPFMARRTVGAFDLCGFFVNTLPVTVEASFDRSFAEHAGTVVREAVDQCRSNVDVSFNQLVAEVAPDRSTNRNPLFAAMMAMQDTFDTPDATSPLRGIREPSNGTAKFDLWLGVTPLENRWLLELEYDQELVPPAVAAGLMDSLRTAARRAVADPTVRLAEMFDNAPVARSARTDGYPAEAPSYSLIDWIRAAARRRPDAVAIESISGTLTYAELERAWTRVASGLMASGVDAGDVVGLCLDALTDTVTTMLAILECGAAYLPLDPNLPQDRLAYMVEQAGCRLIVGSLDGAAVPVVSLSRLDAVDRVAPEPADARPADAQPGRTTAAAMASGPIESTPPVYVMYTSGSTGRPKGVYMGHGPLRNLTAWQIAALEMGPDTRFMQYAPLGFDVSFQEIVPTLAAGGTVVSREPADRRDFPALARRIERSGVSHIYLPVAALRPLTQQLLARRVSLPELRYLCVSGEQLRVDDEIRAFFREHPHCTLVNLYGPTETHAVTTYRLHGLDPSWPQHVPIGLPIAGVRGYVVDVTSHLAPMGVPGELYLGGVCPADGYINDPTRTAHAFMQDLFDNRPGAMMYRTGDRVMSDDQGQLIFLGRDDDQVKIRGYRIELGELEVAAQAHPNVRQAVAAVRGADDEKELVLAVQTEADSFVDTDEVRQRLAVVLPGYMVPTWVFSVERVPTTSTGKTDRDAITRLAGEHIAKNNEKVATAEVSYADDLERELAGLWSNLLGVEGILRNRPVLEYGAHSLLVFTALAQVEQRYGVAPPIVDFFRSPTIATLAALVRAGQGAS